MKQFGMKKLGLMTLGLMLVSPALAGGAGQPVARPAACRSIAAIVASDPQLSSLSTALVSAGLQSTLSKAGSYTVFAPTNAAFNKVPSDQVAALFNNTQQLRTVLNYHVVSERATAADLRGSVAGTTEQGQDVTIRVANGQIMINNARVTKSDIVACNGIIHVIDTVLMPKATTVATPAPAPAPTPAPAPQVVAPVTAPAGIDITMIPALPLSGATASTTVTSTVVTAPAQPAPVETAPVEPAPVETAPEQTETTAETTETTEVMTNTLYDVLAADDQFSTLRSLLSDADLTELLTTGEYTIFAPTDTAFEALPEGALAAIASNPEVLKALLTYHVVSGRLTAEQVKAGNLTTAAGTSLNVQASLSPLMEASNGVIYPVDAVLLPAGFVVPTVTEVPADTTPEPAPAEPATTAPAPVTPVTTAVTTTVTDLTGVLGEDRFSTVRELLTQADLLGQFSSGEYTVFLPTNDAFARLDAARLAALRANPDQLRQLLNYFVVPRRLDTAALVAGPLATVAGTPLTLTRTANGLQYGDVVLGAGEPVSAGNVNVYVVDNVLLPAGLP